MSDELEVWVQLPGGSEVLAGRIKKLALGRQSATTTQFRYVESYIAHPGSYNISPELAFDTAPQETPVHRQMFMAFEDAGPDRWGRNLLQARANERARSRGDRIGRLGVFDMLVEVPDNTRQGALRLKSDARWVGGDAAPEEWGVVDWNNLTRAAADVQAEKAVAEDVSRLFRYGSTSPGGARPKAHALKSGRLMLAKMPHKADLWDVSRWEAATLIMLDRAGVVVPAHTLHPFDADRSILLLDRFDREANGARIGYVSARTLLHIEDHDVDRGSYEALAGALRLGATRHSLHQLFRRVAVTVLVNNTDDHMRNHGLLSTRTGWELSPSFDVNPEAHRSDSSTPIMRGGDPSHRDLRELLRAHDMFDLSEDEAKGAIIQAEHATSGWAELGIRLGEEAADIGYFENMFEGPGREWAKTLSSDSLVKRSDSLRRKDLGLGQTGGGGNAGSFATRGKQAAEE